MFYLDTLTGLWKQAAGRIKRIFGTLTGQSSLATSGDLDITTGLLLEASAQRQRRAEAEVSRLLADWEADRR